MTLELKGSKRFKMPESIRWPPFVSRKRREGDFEQLLVAASQKDSADPQKGSGALERVLELTDSGLDQGGTQFGGLGMGRSKSVGRWNSKSMPPEKSSVCPSGSPLGSVVPTVGTEIGVGWNLRLSFCRLACRLDSRSRPMLPARIPNPGVGSNRGDGRISGRAGTLEAEMNLLPPGEALQVPFFEPALS